MSLPNWMTKRQLQVLELAVQGLEQVEIGQRLGIGPRTVEAHVRELRRKARVPTTAALTYRALCERWVLLPDA